MKNYQVRVMLGAITEVSEFKPDNVAFVVDFLKAKRLLVAKQDEFKDVMQSIVELNEEEKELIGKLNADKEYKLTAKEKKIQEAINEKDDFYNTKHQELMLEDCDISLPKIKMDLFPKETLIKHFDALSEMTK